jgi:hypothetical protein
MNASSPPLSQEEREQILQTVTVFEGRVQENPLDCQSLEILKEAYQRLGLLEGTLRIARKLGAAYRELGQLSLAMLELEGALQIAPGDLEVVTALDDLQRRLHGGGVAQKNTAPESVLELIEEGPGAHSSAVPETSVLLMETARTLSPVGEGYATGMGAGVQAVLPDGNEALAKFLVQHRLLDVDLITSTLEWVQKTNSQLPPHQCAASLLGELAQRASVEIEVLLCGILDRSKCAFIPLECYEVDRQVVKMLPESLTLGRLIVPFDLMSRTLMVATANPLDGPGKEAAQQILDYHIQWHLASPVAITKVLEEVYRIAK